VERPVNMTSYELQASGSGINKQHDENTISSVNGFYRCLIGLGAVQLFCGIAALALGIANAIVCGMLSAIGYGIWGSVIVRIGLNIIQSCWSLNTYM